MSNKLTYIIVLNYNAYQDTVECLKSISKLESKKYKIILVDNCSTEPLIDGIMEWISSNNFNNIKLLKSKSNVGYAAGNNLGINYALKQIDCEYIWILNNDTIVKSNALKELIRSDQNSKFQTIWGSKILYPNGKIQSLGCTMNYRFMSSYHNYNNKLDSMNDLSLVNIDYIHGCSMFFKKEIINKIGTLSEDFFMFFEDVDFCDRAKNNGIRLNIAQQSKVVHKEGASVKKNGLAYLATINRIKYAKKIKSDQLNFIYLGIMYKIFKSLLLLRFSLAKRIVISLFK